MSEVISALNGATFDGFATVSEQGLRGMITLRGDLATKPVAAAVKAATGQKVPGERAVALSAEKGVAWMSLDELLVMVPYSETAATVAAMTKALGAAHSLVVDVSDARAVFRVKGAGAREVLAKLAPVDLAQAAFQPGMIRRTRLAQVPAAFWMVDADTFELVCFRSVAQYLFDALKMSAAHGGAVDVY